MDPFLPFDEFVRTLKKKNAGRMRSFADVKASNSQFENMRQYLQQYYRNIKNVNSFVDDEGETWDCIPIEFQPGIQHDQERHFEHIPPPLLFEEDHPADFAISEVTNSQKKTDQYNNTCYCPPGKIPIRRLTLKEVSQFTSVQAFLKRNDSINASLLLRENIVQAEKRKHAFGFQSVNNFGADAITNLWQPPVSPGQFFSLAQIWVQGGENENLQTIEVGWQVSPERYNGSLKARLFIFWTRDNYKTFSYNLEKPNTFKQVSNTWALGGALGPLSTIGGQQFEIRFSYRLFQGAWWLYINKEPIGYYPTGLFGNGVMSRNSDMILMGGEVSGRNMLPPMGSGQPASAGAGRSAYWKNISHLLQDGGFVTMIPTLRATAPVCYSIQETNNPALANGFYFGGPGGQNC